MELQELKKLKYIMLSLITIIFLLIMSYRIIISIDQYNKDKEEQKTPYINKPNTSIKINLIWSIKCLLIGLRV